MDEALRQALTDRLNALRGRRQRGTDQAIAEVGATFRGATRNSRYPIELSRVAAVELEARVDLWLETVKAVFKEHRLAWTASAASQVRAVIEQAISEDYQELFRRVDAEARGQPTDGDLTGAYDRAPRFVSSELALLVYAEEKHRTPLAEQLAAPRYEAVRRAWSKAQKFLESGDLDHASASKEAVGAVEQMARIFAGKPNASLGDTIKLLRSRKIVKSPSLKGMEEIWGWASSQDGVRHGGETEPIDPAYARKVMRDSESALLYLLELDTV